MKSSLIRIPTILLLLFTLLLFPGCSSFDKPTENPTTGQITGIILETWPSYGDITEMRRSTLVLSPDGTMKKLTQRMEDTEQSASDNETQIISEETRSAPNDAYNEIAWLVSSPDFIDLSDEVGGDILDGDFQYITVSFGGESIRKGGLMPSESVPAFKDIYVAMLDAWNQGKPA